MGVATKVRSQISRTFQSGDIRRRSLNSGALAVYFRECCRLLRGFPSVARSERGCRLSSLEVFSYQEGCMEKPDSAVSHVDLAAPVVHGLIAHKPELFRGLVDGLVMFLGYRFFMDA